MSLDPTMHTRPFGKPTAGARLMDAAALFARHLDLAPLRGGARGLVRCIFHEDRSPSLSVDLDAGVFCCHGCGAQGGLKRFAELVGERPPEAAPRGRESAWQAAWRAIQQRNLAEARRRAETIVPALANDHIRRMHKTVALARTLAGQLGPEDARTWGLLERAAEVERAAWGLEADLDALGADAYRRSP